jgi:hypothetical protein
VPDKQIAIVPGMDESLDRRHLPIGTPAILQNTRVKQGARFEHRPGQSALVPSGLPRVGQANWAAEWHGAPVVGVAETLKTGNQDNSIYVQGGDRWGYLGRHSHAVPLRRFGVTSRATSSTAFTNDNVVAVNGLLYVVYVTADGTFIEEFTPEGVGLRTVSLSTGEICARLVWTGSTLYLITNASATVRVRELRLTTFTLGSATGLATAAAGSSTLIDAESLEGSSDWLIAYATSSTNLRVMRMTGTTVTNSADITTTSTPDLYSVSGHVGWGIVAVYADGADAQSTIFTAALGSPSEITIATLSGGEAWLTQFGLVRTDTNEFSAFLGGLSISSSSPSLTTLFTLYALISTAGSSNVEQTVRHFTPTAKPVRVGDDGESVVYVWMDNGNGSWDDVFQSRHVLAAFTPVGAGNGPGVQFAAVSYEHVATRSASQGQGQLASVGDLDDGRFAATLQWDDPGKFAGFDCAVFTLGEASTSVAQAHRHVENAGAALFISGGGLTDISDAPIAVKCMAPENGFAHAPLVRAEVVSGGAALTLAQPYSYLACFRRIDGKGRVQRSDFSLIPTGVVATGLHRRTNVYVTTLGISNRWSQSGEKVVAEVYRSANGGPYFYVNATSSVEPTANTVLLTDASTDASIVDEDGTFDDTAPQAEPPSGARLIKQWGSRLASVGWVENQVQVSKLYRSDTSWEFTDDDAFRVKEHLRRRRRRPGRPRPGGIPRPAPSADFGRCRLPSRRGGPGWPVLRGRRDDLDPPPRLWAAR